MQTILGNKGQDNEVNIWWFAFFLICLYTPLAMVRKLQKFSFGYILGNIMIIATVLIVLVYSIKGLATDGPMNDGFKTINTTKMWDMVGFSFYSFEGIGTVMPIRACSRDID